MGDATTQSTRRFYYRVAPPSRGELSLNLASTFDDPNCRRPFLAMLRQIYGSCLRWGGGPGGGGVASGRSRGRGRGAAPAAADAAAGAMFAFDFDGLSDDDGPGEAPGGCREEAPGGRPKA